MRNFNPLISIVIPVYNGSRYMREAIDSALNQTYKNIEVIVINDGSTDDTNEIAKSYGDRIRYFKKENGGVASALNLAIKKAKGDYISWLSHDDVYFPEKLEIQLQKLSELKKEEQCCTLLYSNHIFIDDKSEKIGNTEYQEIHSTDKLNDSLYPLFNGLVNGCTLLIPKICFEKDGYFNEKLRATQDYDLWFKMFPKYNLMFMEDELVKSRQHENQGSKLEASREKELDDLWIKMITDVTKKQILDTYGSEANFYAKLYRYVKTTKRSKKAEVFLYDKSKEFIDDFKCQQNLVVANMATYPLRIESLKQSVASILPQADLLNIYLNDYKEIPGFLDDPYINCVLGRVTKGDLRDNGKFYFLDKVKDDSFYFTIDDDILYPSDYVSSMIRELEENPKAVLGVHGIIFKKDFSSFSRSRITYHFTQSLDYNLNVSTLGTGTVAFRRDLLNGLNLTNFKSTGMADLWLAAFCKKHNIPMVVAKRNSMWLLPVNLKQKNTLWITSTNSEDGQNEIICDHTLWNFDESVTKKSIKEIKVSVIIPFFNRIPVTIEAIQSAISQTHQNLEIIVINDRSTEDIEVIKKLAVKDKRLRLIDNIYNKGAGGARNSGLEVATGEYIAFLDSDDLFLPNKISEQLSFMVMNQYKFSFTSYISYSKEEKDKSIKEIADQNLFFPSIITNCVASTPTIMVSAKLFKNQENRFPDELKYGQDVSLWISLATVTPCYGLNKALSIVRFSGQNVVLNREKEALGMENILKYLLGKGLLNRESVEEINALYLNFVKFGGRNNEIEEKIKAELGNIPLSFRIKRKIKRNLSASKMKVKDFIKEILRWISPSYRASETLRSQMAIMTKKVNILEQSLEERTKEIDESKKRKSA